MKRWALAVAFVAAVLVGAAGGYGLMSREAGAEDARSIPFHVSRMGLSMDLFKVGDECRAPLDVFSYLQTYQQVIVTNAQGDIVGMKDLNDGVVEDPTTGTSYTCQFSFSITVKDSEFYTVWLGNQRIQSIDRNSFPLQPQQEIWIALPE